MFKLREAGFESGRVLGSILLAKLFQLTKGSVASPIVEVIPLPGSTRSSGRKADVNKAGDGNF